MHSLLAATKEGTYDVIITTFLSCIREYNDFFQKTHCLSNSMINSLVPNPQNELAQHSTVSMFSPEIYIDNRK